MATEADLIQKFKDLNIPVGADFEELIHAAFAGSNLADLVNNYDSRITTVENDLDAMKGSIQSNTNQIATKADDSKVAHLSGTNNFDTVPTVNNNSLLLASSLPSDLARTGQDTNFTGKLQKSGIDVATKSDVTTAVGAATANMADDSKVVHITDMRKPASQVAGMDDINNYYHANASDDAALSAAKATTVPGIFWFEEV